MKPLLDFTDKPQQEAFFMDRLNKSIGAGGGYNSGKSYAMIAKIHWMAEIFAGSKCIIGRKTYGALEKSIIPTYESIAMKRNGGTWNGPIISKFADMTAHYKNGSTIWFVTYDEVKKVRGPNIAFAGISQAEEVAHEIFLELKGRTRQWNPESIAEFMASPWAQRMKKELGFVPRPFNQLICEFNPAPNWVKDEFFLNTNGSNKFYDLPTKENRKYHAEGWLEDLKKSYSAEWYSIFVEGDWNKFGGAVYPEFRAETHGVDPFAIPRHWVRVIGGDWGYRNPAAFICWAYDEMGNAILFEEFYNSLTDVPTQAQWLKDNDKVYNFTKNDLGHVKVHEDWAIKGTYDAKGKTLWDAFIDEGIAPIPAEKDIDARIQLVKRMLLPRMDRPFPDWHPRKGELGSPMLFFMRGKCINWVNEMQNYIWEPRKDEEKNYKEKPKDFKNHAIDAGEYGLMAGFKIQSAMPDRELTAYEIGLQGAKAIAQSAFKRKDPDEEEGIGFFGEYT
jgi:hypothetical protein